MKRRQFIKPIAAMPLALTVAGRARWAWAAGDKSIENIQKNWKSLLARDPKVEWKKILTGECWWNNGVALRLILA